MIQPHTDLSQSSHKSTVALKNLFEIDCMILLKTNFGVGEDLPVLSMVLLGFFFAAVALLSLVFPLFISLHHFCTKTGDFFNFWRVNGYLMVCN